MNPGRPFHHVGVLMGGPSAEREVSLASGRAVATGLEQAGYQVTPLNLQKPTLDLPDGLEAVFIALHGAFGEDGEVQELLNKRKLPYTGPGAASRLAFDKQAAKAVWTRHGIPTAPYEMLRAGDRRTLSLPVVTKPPLQGSSVGLSRVFKEEEWEPAVTEALRYQEEVMVEAYIPGRELTVGLVGETALPIVEIRAPDGYYDYRAKYTKGVTEYIVPAELPSEVTDRCQTLALDTYRLIGGRGMSRVDFRLSPDQDLFVLEINTIPGFTETSLLPKAAAAAGITFSNLCDRILRMAVID